MKTPFTFRQDTAYRDQDDTPDPQLSAESCYLSGWARKIAKALKYDESLKIAHQDNIGVVACRIDQDWTGSGQQIKNAAINFTHLFKNL